MSELKKINEAIATLENLGMDVPAELIEKRDYYFLHKSEADTIDFFKNQKGFSEKNAIAWQELAFNWAEVVHDEFAPEERNRGRGKVVRRGFTVNTPHGTLKVDLSETVSATGEDDEE